MEQAPSASKKRPLLPLTPEQQQLVEKNQALAIWCARRLVQFNECAARHNWDDLLSSAYMGLVEAARRFDPNFFTDNKTKTASIKTRFATYACHVIKSWMIKELRYLHAITAPKFAVSGEESPVKYNPESVEKGRKVLATLSITSAVEDAFHGSATNESLLPGVDCDPSASLQEREDRQQIHHKVVEVLKLLPDVRQRRIVWLKAAKGMTLKQIGEVIGITRERVRQIYQKSMVDIKRRLESRVA